MYPRTQHRPATTGQAISCLVGASAAGGESRGGAGERSACRFLAGDLRAPLGIRTFGQRTCRYPQAHGRGRETWQAASGCRAHSRPDFAKRTFPKLKSATTRLWGHLPMIIDPMAGGGSIPLESARLGFPTLANEYNPVACSVLEATAGLSVPFWADASRNSRENGAGYGRSAQQIVWRGSFRRRFSPSIHAYVFARTVPCPTTKFIDAVGARLASAETEGWRRYRRRSNRGQEGRYMESRNSSGGPRSDTTSAWRRRRPTKAARA